MRAELEQIESAPQGPQVCVDLSPEEAADDAPINLDDPEVAQAATMIQTRWRGKQSRKMAKKIKEDAKTVDTAPARQLIRQTVAAELKERFVDVDILQLDASLHRTIKNVERLMKENEQQEAEWTHVREEFKVGNEERQVLRRLLGNVDVGSLSTEVKGLLKRQGALEYAHQKDLQALSDLADRCSVLDASSAEMKRKLPFLEKSLESAVGRLGDVTPDVTKLKKEVSTLSARVSTIEEKHGEIHGVFERQKKRSRRSEDALTKRPCSD
jgi:chromosome segregation ATPase